LGTFYRQLKQRFGFNEVAAAHARIVIRERLWPSHGGHCPRNIFDTDLGKAGVLKKLCTSELNDRHGNKLNFSDTDFGNILVA